MAGMNEILTYGEIDTLGKKCLGTAESDDQIHAVTHRWRCCC